MLRFEAAAAGAGAGMPTAFLPKTPPFILFSAQVSSWSFWPAFGALAAETALNINSANERPQLKRLSSLSSSNHQPADVLGDDFGFAFRY